MSSQLTRLAAVLSVALSVPFLAQAQTWTPVAHPCPISAGNALLLTDGSVLIGGANWNQWYRLNPRGNDYIHGTWSFAGNTGHFGPLYYSSAVLADGKVIAIGGEYNVDTGASPVWSNRGMLYDPVANSWSTVTPPAFASGSHLGNAACVVLSDGTFMIADPFDNEYAFFNESTRSFTVSSDTTSHSIGSAVGEKFNLETWTLLPDGTVLNAESLNNPHTARYEPLLNQWNADASTPNSLADPTTGIMGPMLMLPSGQIAAFGGSQYNALYTPSGSPSISGSWVATANFPLDASSNQLDCADAPACLLPNGHVLLAASPGVFGTPTTFLDFDGANFTVAPTHPDAATSSSTDYAMLVLPNGQILVIDQTPNVAIYTPTGNANKAWRPVIQSSHSVLAPGHTYEIRGIQFNGITQGSSFGANLSNATNYPLVRIINPATTHVFFARTHDHSSMGVATGSAVQSTYFDVPGTIDPGPCIVQVIANGIASVPVHATITPYNVTSISPNRFNVSQSGVSFTINGNGFTNASVAKFNGTPISTTFVSATQLTAFPPDPVSTGGGVYNISVSTAGIGLTNSLPLYYMNPVASLTQISPSTIASGSAAQTITCTGTFVRGCKIAVGNQALPTTYVNSTTVTATIPASMLATPTTFAVVVVNPSPGGGASSPQTLTVS